MSYLDSKTQRSDCVDVKNYPPVPLCKLCPQCLNVFRTQPTFSRVSPDEDHYRSAVCGHHQTESALKEAALGCVVCQLLVDRFTAMTIHDVRGEHRASLTDGLCYWAQLSDGGRITVTFFATSVEKRKFGSPSVQVNLDPVCSSISEVDEQMSAESLISTTTGSGRSLQLAKHWLRRCEEHSVCRHPVPGSEKVPGRRILIWKDDGVLKARVCWKSPNTMRYATLSHRWGPAPAVRLLLSNARELFDEIPISRLDQVFQHAISITWELGLQYLWIDTLCIFQDSAWDWTAQSRNMGAIYMNAACNIAAASPSGSGLFASRDPFIHFSPHLFVDWGDTTPQHEGSPSLRGFYTLRDSAGWSNNVNRASLNQRGWVSQERELSPCTLTFTPNQVYWKCGEILACESFPNGIPGMEFYHVMYTTRSFRDLVKEEATPEEVVRFWYGFVMRYSTTALTQKHDRLPAAFGMAQALSSLMPGNAFIAGLWESHLAESLLWKTCEYDIGTTDTKGVTVLTDFQVPSWSWASLDCHVICDAHKTWGDFSLVASVVEDGVMTLPDEDTQPSPFVACNRLRVTGSLLNPIPTLLAEGGHAFETFPDIPDTAITASESPTLTGHSGLARYGTVEARKFSNGTLLLPILVLAHYETVMGLLVNPLDIEGKLFSRAGTFEASFKDKKELHAVFGDLTDAVMSELDGTKGQKKSFHLV